MPISSPQLQRRGQVEVNKEWVDAEPHLRRRRGSLREMGVDRDAPVVIEVASQRPPAWPSHRAMGSGRQVEVWEVLANADGLRVPSSSSQPRPPQVENVLQVVHRLGSPDASRAELDRGSINAMRTARSRQ